MVANILPADPPRPWGSKGQNSTFSEHDHVVYQIKGNHKCSNLVANISLQIPPDPRGQNSTFSEHSHVASQIKGNVA